MNLYRSFYGNVFLEDIEKELRRIIRLEKKPFKILTGYGSRRGIAKSKTEAIRVLTKLEDQKVIKGFLPGEVKRELLYTDSPYYQNKLKYDKTLSNDSDYGNEGIIFVFV